MPRTDRASIVVNAPLRCVFDALVDRDDLVKWLHHGGMTAAFERFDAKPGGSYRLIQTYTDPTEAPGKTFADADVVEVRYLDIVPNDRVVQAVDFVSDDPVFAGTMTMTWAVQTVNGGTRVDITAADVQTACPPRTTRPGSPHPWQTSLDTSTRSPLSPRCR